MSRTRKLCQIPRPERLRRVADSRSVRGEPFANNTRSTANAPKNHRYQAAASMRDAYDPPHRPGINAEMIKRFTRRTETRKENRLLTGNPYPTQWMSAPRLILAIFLVSWRSSFSYKIFMINYPYIFLFFMLRPPCAKTHERSIVQL